MMKIWSVSSSINPKDKKKITPMGQLYINVPHNDNTQYQSRTRERQPISFELFTKFKALPTEIIQTLRLNPYVISNLASGNYHPQTNINALVTILFDINSADSQFMIN